MKRGISTRWVAAAGMVFALLFPIGDAAIAQSAAPPIPRTADGKPDLSGFWQAFGTSDWDIEPHAALKPDVRRATLGEVPASLGIVVDGEIPYQPWALARKKENYRKRATDDPRTKCNMQGVPRITYTPLPFQIFQSNQQLTVL